MTIFRGWGVARFRSAGELSHRLPIPIGTCLHAPARNGDRPPGGTCCVDPECQDSHHTAGERKHCTRPQLQVSVASVRSGTHELGAAAAAEEGGAPPRECFVNTENLHLPRLKRFHTSWHRRRAGCVWHRRRPGGCLAPPPDGGGWGPVKT